MQFLNLDDAYKIQKRQWQQCADVAAWKLGGTNFFTKELFKVKELYFGFLSSENIIMDGDQKPRFLKLNVGDVGVCLVPLFLAMFAPRFFDILRFLLFV